MMWQKLRWSYFIRWSLEKTFRKKWHLHRDLNHEKHQISTLKEQQIQRLWRNKLDIFWGTERKSMFLECIKLRRKVVNDEFGEVDHGRHLNFIDIFNFCYSTTSFFLIYRYSRAFFLSKSFSYRCHYFLFFSKFFETGK